MAGPTVSRRQVLRFRLRRHQLDQEPGTASGPDDVPLLDYGVQDTGTDGSSWALAVRGAGAVPPGDLALAWTLRGAPHAYRRPALPAVAVATAPWSEADAAKRIFDAAKPLKAAGIPVLDALRVVAGTCGTSSLRRPSRSRCQAASGDKPPPTARLLGPYDPYLQLRDRELLVADEARRKDLWPVLGRPGAVVAGGEVVGTWRPRTSGRKLTVRIEWWGRPRAADRGLVEDQAERLAAHRGAVLAGVTEA
jgi:hypothetical protein